MAKTLKLAEGLELPIEFVTEKAAFLGRTGSGKSYGAMKLAELMLDAGAQIGAIDPVGVWRSLRVPATKGGRSYDVVVFGGLSGDLPLEPTSAAGELIADLVCDRGLSFVLDISQCIPAEQQRFLQGFFHRFFHRKKGAPSAVHLFLEECQEYLPENPSGAEAITLGHVQRLWKLGRNFGIGGSLISQRPQEIAKKALNMSGTLFAFQMTGPQERKTIKSWVADQGVSTDIESVLQTLAVGSPHVESPSFLRVSRTVRILPRVTADLSSTPKVSGSAAPARPLTPIDVEQLKTAMTATIEKAKADDPKELKKELARVRQELVKAQQVKPSNQQASPASTNVPVLTDSDRAMVRVLTEALKERAAVFITKEADVRAMLKAEVDEAVEGAGQRIETMLLMGRRDFQQQLERKGFAKIIEKLGQVSSPAVAKTPAIAGSVSRAISAPARAGSPPAPRSSANPPADGITKAEQRIIDSVAWWRAAGIDAPTRHQAAFVAGYTVNGHFNNLVGGLRTKGQLDYPTGGGVMLTQAGLAAAHASESVPTREELIDRVLRVLEPSPGRVFKAVSDAGRDLTRDELAQLTGYTVNGHFNNMVGSLRSLGVIEYPRQGGVQLGQMFEALP